MSRPGKILSALALAVVLAGALGACSSDVYYDRREGLTFHGGNAVETNKVAQIIDPWPPAAADRRIVHDGQRMQRAIDRYRTNKTTPLMTTSTSSVSYSAPPSPATPAAGP